MSELEKCPYCKQMPKAEDQLFDSIMPVLRFPCGSRTGAVNQNEVMQTEFCKQLTQAIAETEARLTKEFQEREDQLLLQIQRNKPDHLEKYALVFERSEIVGGYEVSYLDEAEFREGKLKEKLSKLGWGLVAETEAQIAERLKGLGRWDSNAFGELIYMYSDSGITDLIQELQPQSDSVNDGSNIGNSDISIGSTPTNVQKEGRE